MVTFKEGFNFPDIDRVQSPRATLTEDERTLVRSSSTAVGAHVLRLAGAELYVNVPPHVGLRDVYSGTGQLEDEVSKDGDEINVTRQVEQGLEDAKSYIEAVRTIERLEAEYGEGVLAAIIAKSHKESN